jgi:RHS repeat-associated protein
MYDSPVQCAPLNYKFTGKERDAESGLDEFGARYYGSSLGRFMQPDWAAAPTAVPYAHYGNPQSLNLYAYVENNPTTTGDPDGHSDAGTFWGLAQPFAD